ncbi:MAG TPA: nitrate/nitrite transporter NrtS [Stellaceae bacterium]
MPRRSLAAAIVVGTILNLINQGDALFGGRHIDWLKIVLTYVVPYCVATYGAVAFRLEAMREQRPSAD